MKTLKILARVFAIVGLVIDIGMFLYGLIAFIAACVAAGSFAGAALLVLAIIYLALSIVGVIVGISILSSLNYNEKSVALGVLGIIFLSVLGGIFYLMWNPGEKLYSGPDPFEKVFGEDYKERTFDVFDKVVLLDDCSTIQPKIQKGEVAYVIKCDKSNRPAEQRYTKVLFMRKNMVPEIYDFHNFVFNKAGVMKDDYPYSDSGVSLNKTMKLNHDYKDLACNDQVVVKKVFLNEKYPLLEKCLVEHVVDRQNKKPKIIKRKLYSFLLSE